MLPRDFFPLRGAGRAGINPAPTRTPEGVDRTRSRFAARADVGIGPYAPGCGIVRRGGCPHPPATPRFPPRYRRPHRLCRGGNLPPGGRKAASRPDAQCAPLRGAPEICTAPCRAACPHAAAAPRLLARPRVDRRSTPTELALPGGLWYNDRAAPHNLARAFGQRFCLIRKL